MGCKVTDFYWDLSNFPYFSTTFAFILHILYEQDRQGQADNQIDGETVLHTSFAPDFDIGGIRATDSVCMFAPRTLQIWR